MFKKTLCGAALGLALSASFGAVASAQNAEIASFSTGANYFSAGALAEAGAAFDRAIAAESNDPRVYYFRGLCAARQNDLTAAAEFYSIGAQIEVSTEKGRLTDVNGALVAIQGAERAPIEAARKAARESYKAAEAKRQQVAYGETLDRQRARLATAPNKAETSADAKSDALAVAPIRPFSRAEVAARQVPNLYDKSSDEFKYFREDLGKAGVSTKTKARMAELASRVVYDDPMDKPAADGSPFINIYAESEIFADGEKFVGTDDPDTIYEADEKNLLNSVAEGCQLASQAISARLGAANAQNSGSSAYPGSGSTPYPSGSSGYPTGSAPAAQPVAPSASDDTKLLFEDATPEASPFGEKATFDAANDFELFKADREFKPAAPASATGSASGMGGPGMGMGPGGPGVSK